MSDYVRLNKHLAHTLGMSRREADERISRGEVIVNGKIAILGTVVQPNRDEITLNSDSISKQKKRYTYVLLNKPEGYVCSRKKQGDSPTIYELLPREYQSLKVAGRLDKDSCGLLLLTDDGDTIFKLTHPKFGKKKVYTVGLNKPLKDIDLKKIETGVHLEDGTSKFLITSTKLHKPTTRKLKPNTYTVTMYEGRNRQIRRTLKALGYSVTFLERTHFGPYVMHDLHGDQMKQLTVAKIT